MQDKNVTEVLDQQWVPSHSRAVALQKAVAPAAAAAGLIVGITPAPRVKGAPHAEQGFMVTVERPWCPLDCGCHLGPDANGNHDANLRHCDCDGPCTSEG